MKRSEVCLTVLNGSACEKLVASPPRCELFRCCGSGEPSAADYRAACSQSNRRCPHPDGDRWASAEIDPPPAWEADYRTRQERIVARVAECVGVAGNSCEAFTRPLDCADVGPLNARLGDPAFACPRGRFKAEAV